MKQIIAIVGLLAMACAAPTHVFTSYQDWDANKDGAIQRAEFVDGYFASNYFKRWSNGAGAISYDEFLDDAFAFVDKDNNAQLSRSEFESQMDAYYFGLQSNSFDQWDKNSNGAVDKTEFIELGKTSHLPILWDSNDDKKVNEYEMASGMYDLCNANKDLKVDQQEFDAWRATRNNDVSSAQVLHQ